MRAVFPFFTNPTDTCLMHSVSPLYAAAELKAHEQRSHHSFAEAAGSAEQAAEIALSAGDATSWWNMTFLQAENLLDAEAFNACVELGTSLLGSSSGPVSERDQARTYILLAKARQGAGLIEQAADCARAAAELTSGDSDLEINVQARQALIAALADGGQFDEAWAESKSLASVISDELDDQLAGKVFWVVGNVAFLCGRVQDGLHYHELAASTFSPTKNLDVWAKFNKASAAMRLAADVADADTLRCIERAELATDIIGGTQSDLLLLRRNRANWNLVAGDTATAVEILEDICTAAVAPQLLGDAWSLLGRAYLDQGKKREARHALTEAASHFEDAGAQHRAEQAREFLADELGSGSLWSRLWSAAGFGRH